eukprot:ANDGO_00926.mRNA.1 hypothetical protein
MKRSFKTFRKSIVSMQRIWKSKLMVRNLRIQRRKELDSFIALERQQQRERCVSLIAALWRGRVARKEAQRLKDLKSKMRKIETLREKISRAGAAAPLVAPQPFPTSTATSLPTSSFLSIDTGSSSSGSSFNAADDLASKRAELAKLREKRLMLRAMRSGDGGSAFSAYQPASSSASSSTSSSLPSYSSISDIAVSFGSASDCTNASPASFHDDLSASSSSCLVTAAPAVLMPAYRTGASLLTSGASPSRTFGGVRIVFMKDSSNGLLSPVSSQETSLTPLANALSLHQTPMFAVAQAPEMENGSFGDDPILASSPTHGASPMDLDPLEVPALSSSDAVYGSSKKRSKSSGRRVRFNDKELEQVQLYSLYTDPTVAGYEGSKLSTPSKKSLKLVERKDVASVPRAILRHLSQSDHDMLSLANTIHNKKLIAIEADHVAFGVPDKDDELRFLRNTFQRRRSLVGEILDHIEDFW